MDTNYNNASQDEDNASVAKGLMSRQDADQRQRDRAAAGGIGVDKAVNVNDRNVNDRNVNDRNVNDRNVNDRNAGYRNPDNRRAAGDPVDRSKTYDDPNLIDKAQPGLKINPPFGAKEAVVDARYDPHYDGGRLNDASDSKASESVRRQAADDELQVTRGSMSRVDADARQRDRSAHFGIESRPALAFDTQNVNAQIDVIRQNLRALFNHTGPVPPALLVHHDMGWPALEKKRADDAEAIAKQKAVDEEARLKARGEFPAGRPYAERVARDRDSIVDGTRVRDGGPYQDQALTNDEKSARGPNADNKARDPSYHGGSPRALTDEDGSAQDETPEARAARLSKDA